ncbi:MAG: nucleotide-binding universal stress UspA family protein [Verrucomicrobiales bacterium]|jgi:nucleotide-binding universal stress UspA family protein
MKTSPIRRILVPLDASTYTDAATELACDVALKHEAGLEGLAAIDTPSIRREVAPADMMLWPAVIDAIGKAEHDCRASITSAREKFAAVCNSKGATHHETQIEGLPSNLILEVSAVYDLVVMGLRTYFHYEKHGVGDSLAKVLDRTASPVLAVPQSVGKLERVLIAYDGSFSAGRALRDFAGFAQPFNFEVTLFTAHENEEQAEQLLARAGACLRAHEIGFQTVTSKKPAMVSVYEDGLIDGADLVVAGIHARKFIKDAFVGSFTNQLIEREDTALFLSH